MNRFFIALLLALAPLVSAAQGDVAAKDAQAMRAVIEAQLDALLHDDAERAFSLATPAIRATFGTAEKFLAMVRSSYPVVYRPGSVQFDPPVVIDAQVVQPVRLTDREGHAWIALYPMQRQADGAWLTNGCQLLRMAGLAT